MQALILAGGLGTRLREVVNDRPKPMALIEGKPFLEYVINNLRKNNITDIILAVGYMGDTIEEYFNNGSKFGVNISYSYEKEQLGTGGAIKNSIHLVKDEDIFILNGDTYFSIEYSKMLNYHKQKKSILTMALRKEDNAERYGTVELDNDGRIRSFIEKNRKSSGFINGGTYIINRKIFNYMNFGLKYSLENDIFPLLISNNDKLYGFESNDYFIDIGIPSDYLKIKADVKEGVINDN